MCVRGQGGRGTEEAGILRRKTAPGSEDAEKEVWAGGPMRDGKVQGKAGLLTVSTMLSLPLCTKDVATVKETRWIDRDDSSAKQQPSLYLKLLFQGTHATMQSRTPNPQPKHMLWQCVLKHVAVGGLTVPRGPRCSKSWTWRSWFLYPTLYKQFLWTLLNSGIAVPSVFFLPLDCSSPSCGGRASEDGGCCFSPGKGAWQSMLLLVVAWNHRWLHPVLHLIEVCCPQKHHLLAMSKKSGGYWPFTGTSWPLLPLPQAQGGHRWDCVQLWLQEK